MKQSQGLLVWGALVLLAATDISFGQIEGKHPPVTLPGTESREFYSKVMQQDFNIYVQLPLHYDPNGDTKYPVMYVTDGNRSFPLFANMSRILSFPDTGFPQILVVGIAYPIDSMADWVVLRTRDLTPTRHEETEKYWASVLAGSTGRNDYEVRTGGASRFLEFITSELIPFIESEYRASAEDRALGGYSYGGLFTLYALFEKPQWFGRYFAGSPSLHYDGQALFRIEEEFAASDRELDGKLFLSAGQLESEDIVNAVKKLSGILEVRKYSGLETSSHVFEGENHRSAYPASAMRAYTWLYADHAKTGVEPRLR